MKIEDRDRPWMFTTNRFLQRAYDTWAVLTGEWSLHRAWQSGKDKGGRKRKLAYCKRLNYEQLAATRKD